MTATAAAVAVASTLSEISDAGNEEEEEGLAKKQDNAIFLFIALAYFFSPFSFFAF